MYPNDVYTLEKTDMSGPYDQNVKKYSKESIGKEFWWKNSGWQT